MYNELTFYIKPKTDHYNLKFGKCCHISDLGKKDLKKFKPIKHYKIMKKLFNYGGI